MERSDELTAVPVVGRFYLVPTVRYPWIGRTSDWPIIGPKHEDAEIIRFPWQHYHVDGRFLNVGEWEWIGGFGDFEGIGHDAAYTIAAAPLYSAEHPDHPSIVYRRRRCHRSTVNYPFRRAHIPYNFLAELQRAYQSKTAGHNCRLVCPHRGAPLDSIQPDNNGVITCPLHGLRWHPDGSPAWPRIPELFPLA